MATTWTLEDINLLKDLYPDEKAATVAKALGKPVSSIRYKAYRLGLKKSDAFWNDTKKCGRLDGKHEHEHRKLWSAEEDQLMRDLFPEILTRELAKKLGRSMQSVRGRAYTLGLNKSEAFMNNPDLSGRLSNFNNDKGKATRFTKGHIPANKGKSLDQFMNPETIKKFKQNRFKPGHTPHNTKSDGHISIRNLKGTKYKFIRLSLNDWIPYHHYIWCHLEGRKIPKGMNLVFKDKNTLNCHIDNLELITNEELMSRNTIHRFPEELKSTIRTLSKLKKTIQNATE